MMIMTEHGQETQFEAIFQCHQMTSRSLLSLAEKLASISRNQTRKSHG